MLLVTTPGKSYHVAHKTPSINALSAELRDILKKDNPSDSELGTEVDAMDFLEFSDVVESVKRDVEFLKESPLILKETVITGWVYQVEDGKVNQHCRRCEYAHTSS